MWLPYVSPVVPDWCYQSQHTCATPCNGDFDTPWLNFPCNTRHWLGSSLTFVSPSQVQVVKRRELTVTATNPLPLHPPIHPYLSLPNLPFKHLPIQNSFTQTNINFNIPRLGLAVRAWWCTVFSLLTVLQDLRSGTMPTKTVKAEPNPPSTSSTGRPYQMSASHPSSSENTRIPSVAWSKTMDTLVCLI